MIASVSEDLPYPYDANSQSVFYSTYSDYIQQVVSEIPVGAMPKVLYENICSRSFVIGCLQSVLGGDILRACISTVRIMLATGIYHVSKISGIRLSGRKLSSVTIPNSEDLRGLFAQSVRDMYCVAWFIGKLEQYLIRLLQLNKKSEVMYKVNSYK